MRYLRPLRLWRSQLSPRCYEGVPRTLPLPYTLFSQPSVWWLIDCASVCFASFRLSLGLLERSRKDRMAGAYLIGQFSTSRGIRHAAGNPLGSPLRSRACPVHCARVGNRASEELPRVECLQGGECSSEIFFSFPGPSASPQFARDLS